MSDVSKELELASRVVAMCRVSAECGHARIPFERIWNDIKTEALAVVFSQAKILIDADKTLNDAERANIYYSLGRFFVGIMSYARKRGVVLKIRNGT